MERQSTELDEKIEAIYARIPRVKCRKKCFRSCGPIGASGAEIERLAERGIVIERQTHPRYGAMMCSLLDDEGRCSIYPLRPAICRLWGVVERLRCPYGCRPKGGWINDEEAAQILADLEAIESSFNKTSLKELYDNLMSIIPDEGKK